MGSIDQHPAPVVRFARWEDMDAVYGVLHREFGAKPNEVRTWVRGIEANLSTMLVLQCGTNVVGFGGVQFPHQSLVLLVSDCVDAVHRGKGFGSALVLARFAMLDQGQLPLDAGLLALERNIQFYSKFGFAADGSVIRDPALGWSFYRMERKIGPADVQHAVAELRKRGVSLALDAGE